MESIEALALAPAWFSDMIRNSSGFRYNTSALAYDWAAVVMHLVHWESTKEGFTYWNKIYLRLQSVRLKDTFPSPEELGIAPLFNYKNGIFTI